MSLLKRRTSQSGGSVSSPSVQKKLKSKEVDSHITTLHQTNSSSFDESNTLTPATINTSTPQTFPSDDAEQTTFGSSPMSPLINAPITPSASVTSTIASPISNTLSNSVNSNGKLQTVFEENTPSVFADGIVTLPQNGGATTTSGNNNSNYGSSGVASIAKNKNASVSIYPSQLNGASFVFTNNIITCSSTSSTSTPPNIAIPQLQRIFVQGKGVYIFPQSLVLYCDYQLSSNK